MGEGAVAGAGGNDHQIQIEFVIESSHHVSLQFAPNDTLATAKTALGSCLNKDPHTLHFLVEAHDSTPLSSLFSLTINVAEGDLVAIRHDPGDGRRPYAVYTRIVRTEYAKPFLGGFAHRQSGVVFHHAVCQTDDLEARARRAKLDPDQRHRDTQTVDIASRHIQTTREAGVQAPRPGLVLDTSHDREVIPRPYVDAETVAADRLQKIVMIQCFVRHRFACRRALALLKLRMAFTNETIEGKAKLQAAADAERELQIERRLHPQTKSDFGILLAELQQWRQHEHERILKAHSSDPVTRHRLLQNLLDKQVKLLQTIDRLRASAITVARKMGARLRLKTMAAPKAWQISTGEIVMVEDPKSLRARDLQQLYTALQLRNVTTEERLDLLLNVKGTVRQYDTDLTHDISDLIDREADLLNRGRSVASLAGLRQRLVNLFYQFVCEPEFNPQALCS